MITSQIHTLTPAYGRDYKTKTAAIADLESGKDWITQPSGRYCSTKDIPQGATVTLRYGNLRKTTRYTKP